MKPRVQTGSEPFVPVAELTREQLETRLAAAEEQLTGLRFVLAVAPELHRVSSAGELWEEILRTGATLLAAEHGFVARLPEPAPSAAGDASAERPEIRAAIGLYGEQQFHDLAAPVRRACGAAAAGALVGIGTEEVAIPLHAEGRVAGVAFVHARSRFAHHREVLEAFAAEASAALRNALLFAATTADPVTGVFRRAFVLERLQQELKAGQRRAESCSVLWLDVPHFGALARAHGKAAGDHALQTLGAMLRLWLRDTDVIGRTGTAEFLLVLPGTPAAGAAVVVQRLLQQAAWFVVEHDGQRLPIRFRVGAATLLPPSADESLNLDSGVVEAAADAVTALARTALQDGSGSVRVRETHWPSPQQPHPPPRPAPRKARTRGD